MKWKNSGKVLVMQNPDFPSDANLSPLTLSSDEVEKLYQLMKNELIWAATHGSRIEDYRDPLYDKLVKLRKEECHDSHDEYEYWRDWLEKNRVDHFPKRPCSGYEG